MSSTKNKYPVQKINVNVILQVHSKIKVQLYLPYCPYKNVLINGLKFKNYVFEFTPICVALYLLSDLAAKVSLSSARNSTVTLKSHGWNHTKYDTKH